MMLPPNFNYNDKQGSMLKKEKTMEKSFMEECIKMTEEDHVHLLMMFNRVSNILEHMASLWEQ